MNPIVGSHQSLWRIFAQKAHRNAPNSFRDNMSPNRFNNLQSESKKITPTQKMRLCAVPCGNRPLGRQELEKTTHSQKMRRCAAPRKQGTWDVGELSPE